MAHLKKLLEKCKSYEIVSFDIFDTLLKRDVYSPIDVFKIVELQYDKSTNKSSNFTNKRKTAEKFAREISQYDEITLDEIYDVIEFPEEERDILKQMELNVERSVLHVNHEIEPLFRECIASGKTVYIVSDMYLPIDFIEDLLKRESISEYKKLYLSCDYRRTKRSGDLFRIMCEEEGLKPKTIIHIGDSRYADYIAPRKIGMHSFRIPRRTSTTLYMSKPQKDSDFNESCLYSFVNTRECAYEDRGVRLGFEILGPIIYAYSCWLHNNRDIFGGKVKIWFAARDMYLFKEAYKHLFPDDESAYIYLSRKSLRPVYVAALGDITRAGDVFARGNYSFREIIKYLGYSLDDVDFSKVIDIDSRKYNIRKLETYPEIVKALSCSKIIEIEKKRAQLGEMYLEDQGLFDNKIIFADVGWHGTTQLLLQTIQKHRDDSSSIFGMYIGCLDGTKDKIGANSYKTFLFDEEDDSWFKKGIILFESMILAPHGSTAGYRVDGDSVLPVLSKPEEKTAFIESIQKGAMCFIRDYSQSILSKTIKIEKAHVSSAFERMTCKPHNEEIAAIGDLEYDNFYCNKMAAPKRLRHYVFHAKDLKTDLKYSPWRIGFLYRLLRIRLPYAKLYSYARKRQGKQT